MTLWRKEIWNEIKFLKKKKKLICAKFQVMKHMLWLKIGKHLSSKFKVNKGLRQGDTIALLLFIVVWGNCN